ncbi:MAG: NUDIX domain-containing protein [Candidatus Pacebacteria bacterium]|nr:NUDIX domain-containing protein [Candidatus Paceibacterota bacterium]
MSEQKFYPEPVVGILIFNPEGKIFLMRSPKWGGDYSISGGHIELGETFEQAIKREAKEETGLDVFDINFLQVQECIFDKNFYKKKHFVFLDYFCKTKNTNAVLDEREGTDYVWVTIDEALRLPLVFYTKNTILGYERKYK